MESTTQFISNLLHCRSAGGHRLYTQGFSVRRRDADEIRRLSTELTASPPDVLRTAVELLCALDGEPGERLIWIRETVAVPHLDPWSRGVDADADAPVACFARLSPALLNALVTCAERHGACLDRVAAVAVGNLARVQRLVAAGFVLRRVEPVALDPVLRPRLQVSRSAA